jgi:hypothetical protein
MENLKPNMSARQCLDVVGCVLMPLIFLISATLGMSGLLIMLQEGPIYPYAYLIGLGIFVIGVLSMAFLPSLVSDLTINRERDAILQGYTPKPSPTVPTPTAPTPRPLTPDEKIDALYQLSKRQGRLQFVSNLAWATFGVVGGYLVGRILPH